MGQGRFAGGSGFDATAGNFGDGLAIVESFVSLGTFTEASSDPSGETPGDGAGAGTRDVVVAGDAVNGVFSVAEVVTTVGSTIVSDFITADGVETRDLAGGAVNAVALVSSP